MAASTGLRFEGTAFWVRHRQREYGPFDYVWANDFLGIELTCGGRKFGEYCSTEEITADLKDFRLPMRVVEVSSVVCGALLFGLLNGLEDREKLAVICYHLEVKGLGRFADNIVGWESGADLLNQDDP